MVFPENFYEQKFLQHIMWKKVCDYNDILRMYKDCIMSDREGSEESQSEVLENIATAINKTNAKLRPVHLEIARGHDEKTGEAYYVFISTHTGDLPKFQTAYSKNELLFFKKLMACIVNSGEGKVPQATALNLTTELDHRFTKQQLQDLIARLIQDKWLADDNGSLTLSIRSRLEFAPYLRSEFEDILTVCICKSVVLGYFAICSECGMKIHLHCLERYFKGAKEKYCPSCSKPWKEAEKEKSDSEKEKTDSEDDED